MRALINLEKRGKDWVVFMRSGRIEYSSTCYAKAVGVSEYLEQRREAQRQADQEELKTLR